MSSWASRPAEERALLNPAFCSYLLWQGAVGHQSVANSPLPFEVAFLVLPMVLHRSTRELLPKMITTSLAVWINENPLAQSFIADRAQSLVPFTKEAMMFGGVHQFFSLKEGMIIPNNGWKKLLTANLKDSTDEVRLCGKRAEFIGRWFAKTGNPSTVMAIMGVKL